MQVSLLKKLVQQLAPSGLFDFKAKNPIDYGYSVEGQYGGGEQAYLGSSDAARHMGWMGEMQRRFGKPAAFGAGAFHEMTGLSQHPLESKMDWHNNAIALKKIQGAKSQEEVSAMLKELMQQAVEVNTLEEYMAVKDKDIPFYVGELGKRNPRMFEENLQWKDPMGDTTK